MQYIKEDIENMLIKHKENEGKKIEIEIKLYEYQKRLDYAGTVYEDTAEEVVALFVVFSLVTSAVSSILL